MSSPCECPICFDEITPATGKVTIACNHTFHFRCIANWFDSQNTKVLPESCPCCRREVSEIESMPVISEGSESESEEDEDEEDEDESEDEDEDEDEEESEEEPIQEYIKLFNEKMQDVFGRKGDLAEEIKHMENHIKQDIHAPELMVQYARAKLEMTKIIKHGEVLLRGLKACLCLSSLEPQVAAEDQKITENQKVAEDQKVAAEQQNQKVAEWRAKVDAQWPSASALCPVTA